MNSILHYISQFMLCANTPILFTILSLSVVGWRENIDHKIALIAIFLLSIVEVISYFGVILPY